MSEPEDLTRTMSEEAQATVLAVDDNDAVRYSLSRYLREGGYGVMEARTGTEALHLARQNPALITLDINLPDMDGFEVCRRLKQDPLTSGIPVLHVSASFVGAEYRVRGLEGGADAYLSEPISQQELLATVRALLRLRQAQREAERQAADAEKTREELKRANERLEFRVRERTVELERRNADVQELSRRLLKAQDDERRRVSRELHDSTGQLLVALKLNLSQLKAEVSPRNAEAERLLDDTSSMIEEMTRQIRTLSYLLHPPLLDEAGIASAVKWYVEGFGARSNIDVSLDFPPNLGRLSQDMETTIFRLIQESLTNIHRHSGSETASIRVVESEQEVSLEIRDEGKGLVLTDHGSNKFRFGVGILGMKERVSLLGGTFEISSNPSGTTVRVVLPTKMDRNVKTEHSQRPPRDVQ